MSRLAMDDVFYGKPERVRYVAGHGGGYGGQEVAVLGHQQQLGGYRSAGAHYFSDGDDYYSHRSHSGHSGRAPVYLSSASGRPVLPDVQLSVPLDSQRCVEKVKQALDISGVYSVNCCVPTNTVTVSGNIAPQALLKRVKQVKRKAKILSFTSLYNAGYTAPRHGHTSSSSAAFGSYGYRPGQMYTDPARDLSYYDNRNSSHVSSFEHPVVYNEHYRPSLHHHYNNYY